MDIQVLVADDSPTIQKVISITLANMPFNLIEAYNLNETYEKLAANNFQLLLLDFNLTTDKTGYDIARDIKKKYPALKILAMLGTFDTEDSAALKDAGISESIVKPFESAKFINKCKILVSEENRSDDTPVSDDHTSEIDISELGSDDNQSELGSSDLQDSAEPDQNESEAEEWQMDSDSDFMNEADNSLEDDDTEIIDLNENEKLKPIPEKIATNQIEEDLGDWGIEVPGVIGDGEDSNDEVSLPPIIENDSASDLNPHNFESEDLDEEDQVIMPDSGELDYPDDDMDIEFNEGPKIENEITQKKSPKSKLIPLDDLAPEPSLDDSGNISLELEPENREDLEKEIEDDISPDEFWAVDDNMIAQDQEISTSSAEKIVFNDMPEEDKVQPQAKNSNNDQQSTEDHLTNIDESTLNEIIKKTVEEYLEAKVKNVLWEVIPELAENLIKKELKEVSEESIKEALKSESEEKRS